MAWAYNYKIGRCYLYGTRLTASNQPGAGLNGSSARAYFQVLSQANITGWVYYDQSVKAGATATDDISKIGSEDKHTRCFAKNGCRVNEYLGSPPGLDFPRGMQSCYTCSNLDCRKDEFRTGYCNGNVDGYKCEKKPTCEKDEYVKYLTSVQYERGMTCTVSFLFPTLYMRYHEAMPFHYSY